MNILKEIIDKKKEEVDLDKKNNSLEKVKKLITKKNFSFKKQLSLFKELKKIALIAEVKKASPSKGIFLHNFNPVEIAEQYRISGAACLSVLTEKNYFLGSKEYLKEIRRENNLPILCKDFFIDPYQVYEAASLGADCILILLKSTNEHLATSLYKAALECGLDSIIEVHDENEMKIALNYEDAIIGINNRNLETFETKIETTVNIFQKFNLENRTVICESGINTKNDIDFVMQKTGINSFLVGESLIKSDSISDKIKELIS